MSATIRYDPFERLHHIPPKGLNQHDSKVATKVFLEVFSLDKELCNCLKIFGLGLEFGFAYCTLIFHSSFNFDITCGSTEFVTASYP